MRGHDSQGQTIQTTIAYIGVKEGAETLSIPVQTHGKFRVKEQPEDTNAQPTDTPPTLPPPVGETPAPDAPPPAPSGTPGANP